MRKRNTKPHIKSAAFNLPYISSGIGSVSVYNGRKHDIFNADWLFYAAKTEKTRNFIGDNSVFGTSYNVFS